MYRREELKTLKKDFWNGFAEYCNNIPRLAHKKEKFILYNTRFKGTELKFDVQRNYVAVILEINSADIEKRIEIFDHFKSCRILFEEMFDIEKIIYEPFFVLDTGKEVSRIYVEKTGDFDYHRREDWPQYFQFMASNMMRLERVFKQCKQAF